MKIVRIFEGDNKLLSFKYDNETDCEFDRLFDLWNDTDYLFDFFEKNSSYIQSYFWTGKSDETLVAETMEAASELEEKLLSFGDIPFLDSNDYLDKIFESLNFYSYHESTLRESKTKNRWLRVYALRVDKKCFIITGGAIKITRTMDEHPLTKNELLKIAKCRQYLFEKGITEIEQLEFIL